MGAPINHLRAIRERAQIDLAALAKAAGISERTIRRIEEVDGAPRLEIKARLVQALNSILEKPMATEDVFPGWQAHRRLAKR